jgi:RHS repeat-associated protein
MGFTYNCTNDSNGNVTNDGTNAYTWNQYSKMASVNAAGTMCSEGGECPVYDAFGRVVEVDSGDAVAGQCSLHGGCKVTYRPVITQIWYTQLGKTAYMNGATYNYAYWPTPGGGTLLNTSASINYYMHKDWLGSARIISTDPYSGNGTVITDQAFAPYGEVYNIYGSPSQNQIDFTGLTQDVFAGMYDTPNRELQGAQQGRWLSPDPAGTGWNQYAYSTNPNSNVDPSGLACYPIEDHGIGDCTGSSGLQGTSFNTGALCDPTMDPFCVFLPLTPWPGVGQGWGDGSGGSGISFDIDTGSLCNSDYMPCGLPAPNFWQTLGLPGGMSCPKWMGPQCGGIDPLMDAESTGNNETNCTPLTNGCYNVPTAQQIFVYQLNKGACAFMASGVQVGSSGAKWGGGAAAAGASLINGSPYFGPFAPAVATFGGLVASGGGTYAVGSLAYEAFWQGVGYLSGCNAYGYSF